MTPLCRHENLAGHCGEAGPVEDPHLAPLNRYQSPRFEAAQQARQRLLLHPKPRGHMIADAVAIIGTLDIVFGDIDR